MARLEDDLAASFRYGYHLARQNPDIAPEAILFAAPPEAGGVCYSLAAMWVLRHLTHRSEGPAGRAAFLGRDSSILNATEAHRRALATGHAGTTGMLEDRYRTALLGAFGLSLVPLPLGCLRRGGPSLGREVAMLHSSLTTAHAYHFLVLHGRDDATGHAVGLYTAGGGAISLPQLFLFDPNWGEFKVSVRHMREFLPRLLGWYDGQGEFGRITRLSLGRIHRAV